jgi:glucokinase
MSNITSGKLAAAIEKGDIEIENIVRRAATLLGCGVATVVHLMAPDVIVLGGGLVEAMPELYIGTVRQSVRDRVLPAYRDSFTIVAAELEDDAGVMGCAAWARKKLEA